MKKFILSTILILNFTYADYIARVPLETNNGGSLSTGSIIFSNETAPSTPPSAMNDWLGCRYGYIGDSLEYYVRTTEKSEGYVPAGDAYGTFGYLVGDKSTVASWSEYKIRRVILNNDGNSTGSFQDLTVDINTYALTTSRDYVQHESGDGRYYYRGNLMIDNGSEKYYELCITDERNLP